MSLINSNIRLSAVPKQIRTAALAGSFYPADADQLRHTLADLLNEVETPSGSPKALIAPHAGYIYSGSTAAKAYANLNSIKNNIKRVVILGPAHRVYVKGMALPNASAFATPLGNIDIDSEGLKKIKHLPQVQFSDEAHAQEHSIEVHLPFLQTCLNKFSLLPIVVGDASPEQVAQVLELLWGNEETLIVISTDLSHFHDYAKSQQIDSATCARIEKMDFARLSPQQACGCRPMSGLLYVARQRQMQIKRLGLCNSGDTAGSKDRVVGYGSWSLYEKTLLMESQRQALLTIAKKSIELGFNSKKPLPIDIDEFSGKLTEIRASFVTLKINNQLRGCIGTTDAVQALVTSVANNAFSAAFRDPRFKPLSENEFKKIELSIAILTPQVAMAFNSEKDLLNQIMPGKDGLTIMKGNKKATFLPAVWESLPDANNFLNQLKLKAGLKLEEQVEQAWKYTSESFA